MTDPPASDDPGHRGYYLKVAGITIGVAPVHPSLHLVASASSQRFLADRGPVDLGLTVDLRPLAAEPVGPLIFDSGGPWRLHGDHDRQVYRIFDSRLGTSPYKEARLASDLRSGEVWLSQAVFPPREPLDPLEFPLDELLFQHLLSSRNGFEMHACGVVAPCGKGYVFAGHSGDGKTTTARLWERVPGSTVLSDDRIIVRREEEGWWIYGTPWHGEADLAETARAPLAAVLLLEKARQVSFTSLAPVEAVTELLARSFVAYHCPARLERALACIERLAGEVPCLRFFFVPTPGAVQSILEHLW
jgi:hypothetical protein